MNTHITENGIYKALNMILSREGDFSLFDNVILLFTIFLGCIIMLNVAPYCYKYSGYWWRMYTGKLTIAGWSSTPNEQPLLNFNDVKTYEELLIYIQQENARYYNQFTFSFPNEPLATEPH